MNLKDFFLVRCFENSEYRQDFNSGKTIYINSTSHFWNIENTFQQDFEGVIFRQVGEGVLFKAKPGFEKYIKSAKTYNEIRRKADEYGEILGETDSFSLSINGYIYCFYLLPKSCVNFIDSKMFFTNEKAKKDFAYYLQKYLMENKDFYGCIYDATAFCNIFRNGMLSRGYNCGFGAVEYKDLGLFQKIELFQNKQIEKLVFTKSLKYSYQKEFRFFLSPQNGEYGDHISESGINFCSSIVGTFDYDDMRA